MNFILQFDLQATQFINELLPHNKLFNLLFSFFSFKGSSLIIWIIVIIGVIIIEEIQHPGIQKRDIKFVVIFLLSFSITYIVSDVVLKNIIQRPRPTTTISNFKFQISNCPKDFSFPSTHAATAFAAASVLTFFDKKRNWFYYLLAIVISFSRIYLQCHYLLDVIVGGIIGYLISKIILLQTALYTFPSRRKN